MNVIVPVYLRIVCVNVIVSVPCVHWCNNSASACKVLQLKIKVYLVTYFTQHTTL